MKPPNFWTDYFKKPPFSHHNAPANRNSQATSARRNTQSGAQSTRHGCQRNAHTLAHIHSAASATARPRHPKKHTNEAHKPETETLRAASAKQNHTFCVTIPYVSCSKTIPFARQNRTFRTTAQTPLMLNNLQYALRESASRKAQMAEKDTRELGRAAGKAYFCKHKTTFPEWHTITIHTSLRQPKTPSRGFSPAPPSPAKHGFCRFWPPSS